LCSTDSFSLSWEPTTREIKYKIKVLYTTTRKASLPTPLPLLVIVAILFPANDPVEQRNDAVRIPLV